MTTTIADVLASAAPYHVEASDCFDFAARIPDSAVNLLWLDGPYNMGKAEWDTFPSIDAFLAFYDRVLDEARRVLAPNGSLYVCTQPDVGDLLSVRVRGRFNVLNRIRWEKDAGWHKKAEREALRGYLSGWEEIVFAEQFGSDGAALGASGYSGACDEARGFIFEPLRAYLDGERDRAGWTVRRVAEEYQKVSGSRTVTGMAGHWFGRVQWALPTAANYEWLQGLFGERHLRRDYETLRRDYEALRRPFNAPDGGGDLWTYSTVPIGTAKHSCEKPAAMLRDVIAASSRPGDVVCEWFMGSGVGGEQTVLQGRRYLGCDADPEWARRGVARIERALRAPHEAGRPVKVAPAAPGQSSLFER